MSRLPVPGQDDGEWGDILNDFLSVEHNPDGSLKAGGSLANKADKAYVDDAVSSSVRYGNTAGTAAEGNDARIVGALQSGATAGGDLSGTLPSPTVAKINGVALSGTPTSGKVMMATSGTAAAWASAFTVLPYSMPGTVAIKVGALRQYVETAHAITTVRASVGTAPAGASIIVDVLVNGTTIYAAPSSRPTITPGTNTAVGGAPSTAALNAGDYLTVTVAQVGSTTPGADLSVSVTLAYA